MIRFSKVHILLICFVLLLSYAASAENCVLETDDRRMCYDCVRVGRTSVFDKKTLHNSGKFVLFFS